MFLNEIKWSNWISMEAIFVNEKETKYLENYKIYTNQKSLHPFPEWAEYFDFMKS